MSQTARGERDERDVVSDMPGSGTADFRFLTKLWMTTSSFHGRHTFDNFAGSGIRTRHRDKSYLAPAAHE